MLEIVGTSSVSLFERLGSTYKREWISEKGQDGVVSYVFDSKPEHFINSSSAHLTLFNWILS